jgi:ATP-binding cassette subfamily F protein 1
MTDYLNFTHDKLVSSSTAISINNFDLSIAGKQLFKDSKLSIQSNTIYGLIGKNGSGKSSLLKQLYSIQNEIKTNKDSVKIDTLYVEQEIKLDERNPLDFILDSNSKLIKMQSDLDTITKLMEQDDIDDSIYTSLNEKSQELYSIVNVWNPELEKALAIKILKGLGFTETMLAQESTLLSGGWMMRMSLARSLYLKPDLLLLDEPTNHLDLEAIVWLGDYLNSWNKTVVVVSHNIGFLNDTCDYIVNIEDMKLVYYKGNYNAFKECLANKNKEIKDKWDKFEKQLKDIKKKGIKQKTIDFEAKNKAEKPGPLYSVYIQFDDILNVSGNILSLDNASYSYGSNEVLKNITCGIDMDSKIVLVGKNGSGKSTFVKLLIEELKPTTGSLYRKQQAKIGYYNQHFESYLPQDMTPIEYILSSTKVDINSVRQQLGKIKLEKICYDKKISDLSGGQKARVALVQLILMKPHILILDEPTNHLDIETVEALIRGLVEYEGGLLVITHESHLIRQLDSVVWMMDPESKSIKTIESYDDYISYIL